MALGAINLKQRGRAQIDFMGSVFRGSHNIRDKVNATTNELVGDPESLPDDLDERNVTLESALYATSSFRVSQLVIEWSSVQHGLVTEEAFEEIQSDLQPMLDALVIGPATLETSADFIPPYYWQDVDFHRTKGGWDGHPYKGFIHGELIHRKMIDNIFPGGIFKQRRSVAEIAPKSHYEHILDMGCSTAHYTSALAETYPNAKITGVDLSLSTLEHAQRVANSRNWDWRLIQARAEQTGLANSSFDLVTSYILLHELPEEAVIKLFHEAFRLLKPGGDMVMSDVTRYRDMDKLSQWKADRMALYGGEPHWRASASLDLGQIAELAGFVNIFAKGVEPANYPYIVSGTKPL